jgi:hypothetical protein
LLAIASNPPLDNPDHSVERLPDYLDRAEQLVRPGDLARPFMSRRASKDNFCLKQFKGNHKKLAAAKESAYSY